MSDSKLWTDAAPPPMFVEGGLTVAVTDEMRAAEQQPAAPTPPTPPRDQQNLPAWEPVLMQCKVLGRKSILSFTRFEPVEGDVGKLLTRQRDESLAEWMKGKVPQKYLELHAKLLATDQELISAGRREAQAQMAYTRAIETGNAVEEAATWENARSDAADLAVRLAATKEATDMAYLAAVQSFNEHSQQFHNGRFAATCQTYHEALAELSAAISPLLDKVAEAAVLRNRQQNFPPARMEQFLPSPALPKVNLDPPPEDYSSRHQPERRIPSPFGVGEAVTV